MKVSQTLSTNDLMWEMLAVKQCGNGFALIAQSQSKGKGQTGKEWIVQPGKNLTCSIAIDITLNARKAFFLNMIATLAVHSVLADYKIEASIKWPNDILVNKEKIAGILIENQIQGQTIQKTVVGIGININQNKFALSRPVTSMANKLNEEVDISSVFKSLYLHLDYYYDILQKQNFKLLSSLYYKHLFQINTWAEYSSTDYGQFTGCIQGIDENGLLLVKTIEGKELNFNMQTIRFL